MNNRTEGTAEGRGKAAVARGMNANERALEMLVGPIQETSRSSFARRSLVLGTQFVLGLP